MAKSMPAQGKSKVISTRAGNFIKGGTKGDVPKQHAGEQSPGQSASANKGGKGKFANGGKGKMFGKGHSVTARSGFAGKGSNG